MYELLLVDDSEPELNCIVYLIQKFQFPFHITTALNGEEALSLAASRPFDLLITDIQMPFRDGLSLTKEALALQPEMKAVILTAHEEFSYARTALRLGVKEYLLKPIEPEELKATVSRILLSLQNDDEQKKMDALAFDYIRNHLLLSLLDHDPAVQSAESQKLLERYFQNYQILLLFELRRESFADGDVLLAGHLRDYLKGEDYYYLNINPSLGLILLGSDPARQAPSLSSHLIQWASDVCRAPALVSYGTFSSLSGLYPVYKQLEELLENAFLYPGRRIFPLSLYKEMQKRQDGPHSAMAGSASGKIRDVKRYIYQNYGSDLSLDSLAALVYVHPDYLSRLFKKETGMNLNQFIKRFRMEKAKELLTYTQMKVASVGAAVGYPNNSYFCKTFNDFYGVSPEKFREAAGSPRISGKEGQRP